MFQKAVPTVTTALLLALGIAARAATITTWVQDQGTAPTSGMNTANPVIGNNTNNSADNVSISGSLSGSFTASNVGDVIQMTGSMTLAGISNGSVTGDLRFGLFNTNGSVNTNGWLGYLATQSDTNQPAPLWERNTGNTTIYSSTTAPDASQIFSATATGSPKFTDGTYGFTLTLTRQAGNTLNIAYTLDRTSSAGYSLSGSFTDTSVNTFTFDRVGFALGSALRADQFSLNNVNFSLIPVPEPGTSALLAPFAVAFLARRRRNIRSTGC